LGFQISQHVTGVADSPHRQVAFLELIVLDVVHGPYTRMTARKYAICMSTSPMA